MPTTVDVRQDNFRISTDPARLDLEAIHHYLSTESYWAQGIPFATFKTSVDHALNFGLYEGDWQIGYARIVSDFATVAYLGDVFVLSAYRGRGLSKWLMATVMAHPNL